MSFESQVSVSGAVGQAVSPVVEPRAAPAAPAQPFAEVLQQLGRSLDAGERVVQRALSGGGGLDARQLIALQAGIYRYTEAVDLAAKLVDRASAAVRTTLQSAGG